MDTLLAVESLTYRYGDRVAVDSVSLEVRRGEALGLLGPNGAGKTTLLSCVAGLLTPQGGRMSFAGEPFEPRRRREQRARLGLVPQELAVYDDLTARENLDFFARMLQARDPDAAVAEGLRLSALDGRADDRVATFSGGMKRRLNLSVALLHRPELTLLDEPTVGVDPQSRHHLFETLEALRRAGHSMLYTSHSMDEVQRLCDRVLLLDHGKVIACGTPAELADRAGVPGADLERTFLELTGRNLRDAEPV